MALVRRWPLLHCCTFFLPQSSDYSLPPQTKYLILFCCLKIFLSKRESWMCCKLLVSFWGWENYYLLLFTTTWFELLCLLAAWLRSFNVRLSRTSHAVAGSSDKKHFIQDRVGYVKVWRFNHARFWYIIGSRSLLPLGTRIPWWCWWIPSFCRCTNLAVIVCGYDNWTSSLGCFCSVYMSVKLIPLRLLPA